MIALLRKGKREVEPYLLRQKEGTRLRESRIRTVSFLYQIKKLSQSTSL